jgi:hypothetical protein
MTSHNELLVEWAVRYILHAFILWQALPPKYGTRLDCRVQFQFQRPSKPSHTGWRLSIELAKVHAIRLLPFPPNLLLGSRL